MQQSDTRIFTKAPHVLMQELDGEAVLLNLNNGQYYGLDEVGYRMVQLLVSSGSFDTTYKTLLQEYEVDPKKLRSDLEKLLEDLIKNGLVLHG
jgi:hypothetical protein